MKINADILAELRTISTYRGIIIAKGSNKVHLIETLEKADDERTFHKFLDLPAELRVRIYDYHLDTFRNLIDSKLPPAPFDFRAYWDKSSSVARAQREVDRTHDLPLGMPQPSITKVCQLVRQESLPRFYLVHRMRIEFDNKRQWVRWGTAAHPTLHSDYMSQLARSITNHPKLLSEYKKFLVRANLTATNGMTQVEAHLEIDLPPRKGAIVSRQKYDTTGRAVGSFEIPIEDMKTQVDTLMGKIAKREELELRLEDLQALRVIFDNGARRLVVP